MKIHFWQAIESEERLNATGYDDNPANILKDLVRIYAFNSNLELADDFDEQIEERRKYFDELVIWKEEE